MGTADLAVVTYCWREGYRDYKPEHVDALARMVRRHLKLPHRFVCISDETGFGPDVEVLPTPESSRRAIALRSPEGPRFPSSYRRLWLFSEEARAIADRILLLDVDCLVCGDLAPLVNYDEDFVGWRPGSKWGSKNHRLGGGTWLLRTGTHTDVWDSLSPEAAKVARAQGWRGSDQAWLSYKLSGRVTIWPHCSGIYQAQDIKQASYRRCPPGARIVHFNGESKPWNMKFIDWIARAYDDDYRRIQVPQRAIAPGTGEVRRQRPGMVTSNSQVSRRSPRPVDTRLRLRQRITGPGDRQTD
jgi:hypothetical protein